MLRIDPMTSGADLETARELLGEYARLRDVFTCFDRAGRHHKEMAELRDLYSPPSGAFFLAREEDRAAGSPSASSGRPGGWASASCGSTPSPG